MRIILSGLKPMKSEATNIEIQKNYAAQKPFIASVRELLANVGKLPFSPERQELIRDIRTISTLPYPLSQLALENAKEQKEKFAARYNHLKSKV
jgi:hypothetical protein